MKRSLVLLGLFITATLLFSCSPLNPVSGMKDGYYLFETPGENIFSSSLSVLGDTLYYSRKDESGKYGLYARDLQTKQESALWQDSVIIRPVMFDAQQVVFARKRPAEKTGASSTMELVVRNLSTNKELSLSPASENVDQFLLDRSTAAVYFLSAPPEGENTLYQVTLTGGEPRNLGPAINLYALTAQPAGAIVQRNQEQSVALYLVPAAGGEPTVLWQETVTKENEEDKKNKEEKEDKAAKRQKRLRKVLKKKLPAFSEVMVAGDRLLLKTDNDSPVQVVPLAGGEAVPWPEYQENDELLVAGSDLFIQRCVEETKQCSYLHVLPDLSSEPFCVLDGVDIRKAVYLSRGALAALVIQDANSDEKFRMFDDEADFCLLGQSGAKPLALPVRNVPRKFVAWMPELANLAAQNELAEAKIRIVKDVVRFEIPGEGQGDFTPLSEKVHRLQKQIATLIGKPSVAVAIEYQDNGYHAEMEWSKNAQRLYSSYGTYDTTFQKKDEYVISAYNKVTRTTYGYDFDNAYVTLTTEVINITDQPLVLKATAYASSGLLSEVRLPRVSKSSELKKPLQPGKKKKITIKLGRLSDKYSSVGCYFTANDKKVDYFNEYADQEGKGWLETLAHIKESSGFVFEYKDALLYLFLANKRFFHCYPSFDVPDSFVALAEQERLETIAKVGRELKAYGKKHLNNTYCGEIMELYHNGKRRWKYNKPKLTEVSKKED